MGFFSWKTADKNESIANIESGHKNVGRTVYMLQPNGVSPREEESYEGYGIFDGLDAYVWLADKNLPEEKLKEIGWDEDKLRDYGLALDMGSYYEDKNTGDKYGYHWVELLEGVKKFDGDFGTVMKAYGETPNDLIAEGTFIEKKMRPLLKKKGKYNPLKFSFDKNAKYEDCKASKICESQGFFY